MIKDLFAKPIDRDIKGVIKVGQDDSSNVRQELEEYVVTRELQKHFAEFFASYKRGILGTTDKMGVWISGFFGSGKSHFLKILSYLLANKNVDGKAAIDYFIDDQKIIDNITLHILTPNSDEAADEPTMRMLSGQSRCVLVVLPNDRTFLDEIRSALKIEKFIRFDAANAVTKFEQIKEAKKVEMRERSASARLFLTEAMREAAIYVNGDRAQSSAKEISSRINDALGKLVAGVYHKLPYEKLRGDLIAYNTFANMVHLGRGIFGSDFGTTAFVITKCHISGYKGKYRRLFEKQSAVDSVETKEKCFLEGKGEYIADQSNFSKIPGSPIAYWAGENFISVFEKGVLIGNIFPVKKGMDTSDNDRFLRFWYEISSKKFSFGHLASNCKWYPYDKGGNFRRWYGNKEYIVNYENMTTVFFGKAEMRKPAQ